MLLTDHYHSEYFDLVAKTVSTDINEVVQLSDNNLINGLNSFDCSTITATSACKTTTAVSNFQFTAGKVHKLRLINGGAEAIQKFSIDGHTLTVVANDFVPVKPYDTQGMKSQESPRMSSFY